MPVSTALDGLPRPPCAETLGWEIVDASMASLVVAEAVRQIAIIIGYRRGWHG